MTLDGSVNLQKLLSLQARIYEKCNMPLGSIQDIQQNSVPLGLKLMYPQQREDNYIQKDSLRHPEGFLMTVVHVPYKGTGMTINWGRRPTILCCSRCMSFKSFKIQVLRMLLKAQKLGYHQKGRYNL